MTNTGVFVLLPVLNEIANIDQLLNGVECALKGRAFTIGILDDGSRDGTLEYLRERMRRADHHLHLICRTKTRRASQRGSALRVLMLWGLKNTTHGTFIEMDGDLSHRPEELVDGIRLIAEGQCDVAIASKYVTGSVVTNRPFARLMVSRVCSYAVRLLIDSSICDYSNGYRFYARAAAQLAADHAYRYGSPIYLSEILALWLREGMRIREFKSTYIGRNEGISKLRGADLVKAAIAVFEIALRYHLLGFKRLERSCSSELLESELRGTGQEMIPIAGLEADRASGWEGPAGFHSPATNIKHMKLSIIGLGKLGSPMAAVMAHKGHTVVGVDVNTEFVKAVREGRPPVNEPQLAELIAANRDRLSATMDYEEAILATDVTFIIVPTPSEKTGRFSMTYVLQAAEPIGAALRKKDWHLVVLSSTVMPGSTDFYLKPALERYSGKKCGEGFGLCYNPEFIALGSVVRDMLNPDMILIGESDPRSGAILEELYGGVCDSNPRIQRMNYVNAELTKLSVNTFVTTKISYANMLAQVCETLPGADVDVITAAIGCDTRIGARYLKGALGYGGPCFPRDNIAFSALARDNGVAALLAEATDELNRRQVPRMVEQILAKLPDGGTVGVMGLSYKPYTDVIEESQGVALVNELMRAGVKVTVYDPAAMENVRKRFGGAITYAASAAACARAADVLAITTPWPEFARLSADDLKDGRAVVVDCWRMLSPVAREYVSEYFTIGMGWAKVRPRERERARGAS